MPHHSLIRHCMFYIPIEKHDFDSLSISRELFPSAIWKNNKSASIRKNLLNLKHTWIFELNPEFHLKLGILTTLVMWPSFPHFPNRMVRLSFVWYSISLKVNTIWALNLSQLNKRDYLAVWLHDLFLFLLWLSSDSCVRETVNQWSMMVPLSHNQSIWTLSSPWTELTFEADTLFHLFREKSCGKMWLISWESCYMVIKLKKAL